MKQLGLALQQYSQDNDETQARAWYGSDFTYSGATAGTIDWKWMDVIYPYVKNTQIYTCPTKSYSKGDGYSYIYNEPDTGSDTNASGNNGHYGTYVMNSCYRRYHTGGYLSRGPGSTCLATGGALCQQTCLTTFTPSCADLGAVKNSEIEDPSGTFWLGDGALHGIYGANWQGNRWWSFQFDNGTGIPNYKDLDPPRLDNGDYSGALIDKHLYTSNVLFCDGHVKAMKVAELGKTISTTYKVGSTTYTDNIPPYMSMVND